jgi:hypothetical protein
MTRARSAWLATLILFTLPLTAAASLDQFAGEWRNSDPNTSGVTRLDIRVTGTNVTVHAWGKCHPKDCDWGQVAATAYGPNVSADMQTSAQSLAATFQTGFSQTLVILDASASGRLRAQVLTRFTDNSGRKNYRELYSFVREQVSAAAVKMIAPAVQAAAAASALLPAPVQLGPADGMSFDRYPRTTTLTWRPVAGAASYGVEIDCMGCCESGRWCADVGKQWKVEAAVTSTRYVFDFVGAQPGRWRVWAVGANGRGGERSGWWEFRYTK